MRQRLLPVLLAVLLGLVAACSDDGGDSEESSADTTTTVADDRSDDGEDAGDGDVDQDEFDRLVDELTATGFSDETAECAIQYVLDQGFDLSEIEEGVLSNQQDVIDAFGRAGAECVDPSDLEDLPLEGLDLNDPMVRDQFVKNFAATSGLSIEQADCVAAELIERDIPVSQIADVENPETVQLLTEITEGCV